jgi:outer membrane protein X
MNYFFEKNGIDMFDINANAHYLFPMASNVRVYPLAGLTFARWDFGKVTTRLGVNIGGGAEMDIADDLILNFELKYQTVSDLDQAIFNVGVAYIF